MLFCSNLIKKNLLIIFIMFFIIFLLNANDTKKALLVCAASSLETTLTNLKTDIEASLDIKVFFNFAASGILKMQIENGGRADIFVSASRMELTDLKSKNFINNASGEIICKNTILLLANTRLFEANKNLNKYYLRFTQNKNLNNLELKNMLSEKANIIIGNPETVPAGRYGVRALEFLTVPKTVYDKYIRANSVSQVIETLVRGGGELGFAYNSDLVSKKNPYNILSLRKFTNQEIGEEIVYLAVILNKSTEAIRAMSLINYLKSKIAKEEFELQGFATN